MNPYVSLCRFTRKYVAALALRPPEWLVPAVRLGCAHTAAQESGRSTDRGIGSADNRGNSYVCCSSCSGRSSSSSRSGRSSSGSMTRMRCGAGQRFTDSRIQLHPAGVDHTGPRRRPCPLGRYRLAILNDAGHRVTPLAIAAVAASCVAAMEPFGRAGLLMLIPGGFPSTTRKVHSRAHQAQAQAQEQQQQQQQQPPNRPHGRGDECVAPGNHAKGGAQQPHGNATAGGPADRDAGRAAITADGGGGGAPGSGGGGGRVLPLRAALRLLYKQVHPDLFHDHPVAKEENERSFKLLQEYVQLARGGDARSPAARLPYRFAFYLREAPRHVEAERRVSLSGAPARPPLRPPPGAIPASSSPPPAGAAAAAAAGPAGGTPDGGGSVAAAGAAAAVAGLHLVRVMLPPPAISPPGAKELAAYTRKALVKLLAACGLATSGRDGDDDDDDDGAAAVEGGEGGPLSLAAFLPEAVEALRQAEAVRSFDPGVRVANLRGAMRLRHQVMVSFADKQLRAESQVALLERLSRVVEAAGPELRLQGSHIVIGDRLGLDRMGHLCLSAAEADDDSWAAFLTGVDMDFVMQQRRSVQALRSLEAQVARAAGVAQVFTPYGNLMEPSYREFLERLAAAAMARGPLGAGAFNDVSLCAMPPFPGDMPQSPPCCSLDNSNPGVIQVATDAAAAEVYAGVAELGSRAQAAVRMQRAMETQLRELTDRTRQRLRLRSLSRDTRLAPDHFCRACGLLLEHAAALVPLLEGCSVRIGFVNRLAPDGSCLEIAHHFEL